jgi:hypothetical protein
MGDKIRRLQEQKYRNAHRRFNKIIPLLKSTEWQTINECTLFAYVDDLPPEIIKILRKGTAAYDDNRVNMYIAKDEDRVIFSGDDGLGGVLWLAPNNFDMTLKENWLDAQLEEE